jgi:CheY-like chemotaxis protein
VVAVSARVTNLGESDIFDLVGRVRPGHFVEITVTDTGRGMTASVRQQLFRELFFSTKPCHRGLGLAVVYGLLQTFGGGLRFGPDPAQGTAVHLFLPAAAGAQPAVKPIKEPSAPGRRVLVVDDDGLILESVCQLLEQAGHKVKAAPGPAEALACYVSAREPFDLVLTDVMMPGMTGFDLVRRLKQHDPAVNALFLSSLDAVLPRDELIRQFGVLHKPFQAGPLLDAVGNALRRERPAGCASVEKTCSP